MYKLPMNKILSIGLVAAIAALVIGTLASTIATARADQAKVTQLSYCGWAPNSPECNSATLQPQIVQV
jgi:hypothetical protein